MFGAPEKKVITRPAVRPSGGSGCVGQQSITVSSPGTVRGMWVGGEGECGVGRGRVESGGGGGGRGETKRFAAVTNQSII